MRRHQFRNRVAESQFTLPLVAVVAAALWVCGERSNVWLWVTAGAAALMTYGLMELNSQLQLLRIRSRMVSVTLLALFAAFPALHTAGLAVLPAGALLAALFVLFKGYGEYRTEGYTFHAFLFVSAGSLLFPPLLLLVPTLLFSCNAQLRLLTFRAVVASLLGLLLPYWLYFGTTVLIGWPASRAWSPWVHYLSLPQPDYTGGAQWWAAVAFAGVLAMLSIMHFVANSYDDKIRTRQLYYSFLAQWVPVALLTLALPQDGQTMLPLLFVTSAPFIGHYFALAKGRLMNAWFIFCLIALIVIGAMNYLNVWGMFPALTH